MTHPADYFTNTEADAGRFERRFGPEHEDPRPDPSDFAPEWDGCMYCGRGSCADGTRCGGGPDYDDAGHVSTVAFLLFIIAGSLVFLALLKGAQPVVCWMNGDAVQYCDGYAGQEPTQ